jgi:hypothetical protein
MNKLLLCFLVLLPLGMAAVGQTPSDAIPQPKPPFALFPAPKGAFTIVLEPGETKNAAASPLPKSPSKLKVMTKIEVTEDEALRRDLITWDGGVQTETWFVGAIVMMKSPNGDWINLLNADPTSVPRRDASDYFSWLELGNYVGVVSYRDKSCYQFLVKGPKPPQGETDIIEKADKIAWIDVKTKLPVAVQIAGQLYTYTFSNPPTAPLQLPEKFKVMAERYQIPVPSNPDKSNTPSQPSQ